MLRELVSGQIALHRELMQPIQSVKRVTPLRFERFTIEVRLLGVRRQGVQTASSNAINRIAVLIRHIFTVGLVYRPIPHIALKGDYRRHRFGAGDGFNELAAALAWMF